MSVQVTATVRWRPWNMATPGSPSPYPSRVWYIQAGLIGDVSGGSRIITFELNPAGLTRSGQIWSCEYLSCSDSEGVTPQVVRVTQVGLDVLGPGQTNAIQKPWVQPMVIGTGSSNPIQATVARDLWPRTLLGSQGTAVTSGQLIFTINNINLETFGVYASGYVWDPGAVNAPGGLQRPPWGVL